MAYTEAPLVEDDVLNGAYRGEGGRLFWLALGTGMLTLLTLGIYRFWAKARIRRYLWSATAPGGNPFEYTGTGLEKFLGFLVAVVILAAYLGILNVILLFLGFSFILGGDPNDPEVILRQIVVIYANLFALIPLIYFAQYRARRYLLSRTRWRGVRFGAEKGAWGYTWRGCLFTLLGIVTLGLLSPLATFKLEKYTWDRTWYGDAKFTQGGKWTSLYRAMLHMIIAIAIFIGAVVLMAMDENLALLGFVLLFVGYIWLLIGVIYYQVHAWRILAAHKELGDGIRFRSLPRTGTIIGTYIVGSIAVSLLTAIALIPLGFLIAGFAQALGGGNPNDLFGSPQGVVFIALVAFAYIFAIVFAGALTMVFITQPILRHYVEETTVIGASKLDMIRQRVGDEVVDAEGFADALDVGAAF
ncbi:DUF898 family protein [Vannielia litorea]|uniref:Uncharacterized membrane protein YjgN, DUF898 family n=1 Tax=Vannielia litorea TaxID=1217970 RepID=A0A1N6IMZ9_9RHOB|nr:DUF898 family protein [Vannielia litorea]SIO33448.1 Uncharacterized membrane protein YjgN, DUF898 family [Vannielia litorea]